MAVTEPLSVVVKSCSEFTIFASHTGDKFNHALSTSRGKLRILFLITVRQALIMFVNASLALLSCDLTPAISFTIVWVPVDVNSPVLISYYSQTTANDIGKGCSGRTILRPYTGDKFNHKRGTAGLELALFSVDRRQDSLNQRSECRCQFGFLRICTIDEGRQHT